MVDTPCLPIPTPPPLPEAPLEEEALLRTGKVAAKNVPQTVPGTCLVCLSESEEVVGAGWVHQESETEGVVDKKAAGCGISACLPCLKTYFEVLREDARCVENVNDIYLAQMIPTTIYTVLRSMYCML